MAKAKPSVPALTPLEAIDMEIRALQVHQLAAMIHAAQGVRMDGWAFYAEEVEVIQKEA